MSNTNTNLPAPLEQVKESKPNPRYIKTDSCDEWELLIKVGIALFAPVIAPILKEVVQEFVKDEDDDNTAPDAQIDDCIVVENQAREDD